MSNSALQLPNTNLIIGGNFDTNPWQRGTTFTAPATGTGTADCWGQNFVGGSLVFDILKTADAPTVAQAGVFSSNCMNLDVTTAEAAIAAGEYCNILYAMEGYDWAQIAQRTFTLSFWHKHTITGTYCVGFRNSGSDRSYVAEYTQTTTNTWEYSSITVTASPSAGTWDYTTGTGILINFAFATGATFQTTANAWNVGNFMGTANQVNAVDNNANFCKIALVQVMPGAQAQTFQLRTEAQELALCKRYLEVISGVDSSVGTGYFESVTAIVASMTFAQKRVAPTITLSATTLFDANRVGTSATTTNTGATASITVRSARITTIADNVSVLAYPTIIAVNAGNKMTISATLV